MLKMGDNLTVHDMCADRVLLVDDEGNKYEVENAVGCGKYTVEIASKSCESNDICVTTLVVEGDKSEIETIVADVIDEHEDDLTTYDVSVTPYVVPTVLTLDGLREHLGVEFDE